MEFEEGNETSDWNEQYKFSMLYFNYTAEAKRYMMRRQLGDWKSAIMVKFSLAKMILPKKINELDELIDDMSAPTREYNINPNKNYGGFFKCLMETEGKLDLLVNEIMPFLNIDKFGGGEDW